MTIRDTIEGLSVIYDDDLSAAIDDAIKTYGKPMPTSNPQIELISAALDRAQHLFSAKNAEYAGGEDILGNFRRQAESQGLPMSTAWMFLAGKHFDAIQEYVKDQRNGLARSRTQPIAERIDDLLVYALLLHVIVAEEQN